MASSVFLVTYEHELGSVCRDALTNLGFDASLSFDEDDAITQLERMENQPELIVMNHLPAVMNGILTMIEMRRIAPRARVLLMSESRRMHRTAMTNGAIGLVKKPHSVEKFLAVVDRYVSAGGQMMSQRDIARGLKMRATAWDGGADGANDPASDGFRPAASRILESVDEPMANRSWKERRRRSPIIYGALCLIVVALALAAINSLPSAMGPSAALLVVKVHSSNLVEIKDFILLVNNEPRYMGKTGDMKYVQVVLPIVWNSSATATVTVVATAYQTTESSQSCAILTVSSGGQYFTDLYV